MLNARTNDNEIKYNYLSIAVFMPDVHVTKCMVLLLTSVKNVPGHVRHARWCLHTLCGVLRGMSDTHACISQRVRHVFQTLIPARLAKSGRVLAYFNVSDTF